jgi:hypothetical protein
MPPQRQDRTNKRAQPPSTDLPETEETPDYSLFEDDEDPDRIVAERPAKKYKRHSHPASENYEKLDKPLLRKLNRKLRWKYLCQFNKEGWEESVEEIFHVTDKDGWQFTNLRLRVLDTLKGWKSSTLKKMAVC